MIWAVVLLSIQLIRARGRGRKELSLASGNPVSGIKYGFTIAMTPGHKETVRNHPFEFTIGILMHVGVFMVILKSLALIISPQASLPGTLIINLLQGIAFACGIILLYRRISSPNLRAMSIPDDYISILLVLELLAISFLHQFNMVATGVFLINTAILYFYLPLGKLKHALFFFIARGEYSSRLGYRGTWPSASE